MVAKQVGDSLLLYPNVAQTEIWTSQAFYQTSKHSQVAKPKLSNVRSQAPKHHRTCLKPQGVSQMFPLGTELLFHFQVETKRNILILKKKKHQTLEYFT